MHMLPALERQVERQRAVSVDHLAVQHERSLMDRSAAASGDVDPAELFMTAVAESEPKVEYPRPGTHSALSEGCRTRSGMVGRKTAEDAPSTSSEGCRVGGHEPHSHQWSAMGLYIGGVLHQPCNVPDCAAALVDGPLPRVVSGVFPNEVAGIPLLLEDDPQGGVAKLVMRELVDGYGLDKIELKPGDGVIDVGAQVGAVSIYLAKRQPLARIYAFEPVPANFKRLMRNLKANGVENVTAIHKAVTGDGRDLVLHLTMDVNSGGNSAFGKGWKTITVPSTTLADFVRVLHIDRIKLLKLDCEGSEYEIVESSLEMLDRVDVVRGEMHVGEGLGGSPSDLLEALRGRVKDVRMETSTMRL